VALAGLGLTVAPLPEPKGRSLEDLAGEARGAARPAVMAGAA
jgi:hypothetical protein